VLHIRELSRGQWHKSLSGTFRYVKKYGFRGRA